MQVKCRGSRGGKGPGKSLKLRQNQMVSYSRVDLKRLQYHDAANAGERWASIGVSRVLSKARCHLRCRRWNFWAEKPSRAFSVAC
jgi:hypothetical protein